MFKKAIELEQPKPQKQPENLTITPKTNGKPAKTKKTKP